MLRLTIKKPDDFHIHLREGLALNTTVPHCEELYHYVLAMPNTAPPLFTIKRALAYWESIQEKLSENNPFHPLVTLYLNNQTSLEEISEVKKNPQILGYKLYPQNVTTRSSWGIKKIKSIYPLLAEMEKQGVPLMIHGEVSDDTVDIFDREKIFIDRELIPIVKNFPNLKITLEHITTKEAVDFIKTTAVNVKATITPHHLYINRSAIFQGGINPHHYCLPIAKREQHRLALVAAATSGDENFFLGTDSAPHPQNKKENSCGCAGIYTAPYALFFYLEVFYQAKKLDHFENFASVFGRKHYELPPASGVLKIVRKKQIIPEYFPYLAKEKLIPFKNGEAIHWSLEN